jgi:aldehyde:ferredoxin oxidoreductase
MGSKNLKAVSVVGNKKPEPGDPVRLKDLSAFLGEMKKRQPLKPPSASRDVRVKRQICFGCVAGCDRYVMETADGKKGKYMCASGPLYEASARQFYGELNEVPFMANRLCDDFGLDTNVILTMIEWLDRCYKSGILSDKKSELPLSGMGSLKFIEELVRRITFREGFGAMLAEGPIRAARTLGSDAEELLGDRFAQDGTFAYYMPRLYVANGLLFCLEPRQAVSMTSEVGGTVIRWLGTKKPQIGSEDVGFIAKYFWGSDGAGDFTSYQGKALAAKMVQDRLSVKESAILCSFSWHTCSFELFRPEILAEVLSAVTGVRYDEGSLYHLGERIFNMQRAVIVRDRKCGREGDTLPEFCFTTPLTEAFLNPDLLVPGPDKQPVSRRGSVLNREQFETMKDEYYSLRGWDVDTGLQTKAKLNELGLADVADELSQSNFVK